MRRAKLQERTQFAAQVAERDAARGTAPLKPRKRQQRQTRFRLSRAGELRALGDLVERRKPGLLPTGRQLERSIRMMELQEQEYVDAFIDVKDTSNGRVYVSQETTRMIVADCWSNLEEQLKEANAAFNATEDEPHERALALLSALQEAVRHADVIYTLTPFPDSAYETEAEAEVEPA